MTTAADVIARRLAEAGCRHAFGIPGGEVLVMMNALQEAGIAFTLAKHENAAGFMAEGAHHASGAPGILLATIGPGIANAVNVVANAWQDHVPMIVISGCVDPAEAETYTHQVFDHGALLRPVVKETFQAVDGAVDIMIDKALAIAMDARPGPVHIDLPIGLAGKEQPERAGPRRARPSPVCPAEGPDLTAAREMLAAAERPLMLAGDQVLHDDASEAVVNFCRDLGVPLLTTYKAKGILEEDDPLSLGGHGLSPRSDAIVMPLIEAADLIVLAGYDPIEMRAGWRDPWDPAKVIEFSSVPNTHYMHQARFSFIGHIGAGLKALGSGLIGRWTWSKGEATACHRALKKAFAVEQAWGPHAVVAAARRALPRGGIATVDSGAHRILLSQLWECYGPRSLLQSCALCTMGCALPLAIGYKIAAPGRPVVAFTGDAGLEMALGELATLRDLALPIAVVVFVDQSLGLIELKQRASGFTKLGVDFGGTDFVALAGALGGVGCAVTSASALKKELKEAFTRETFTLIACPIDVTDYEGAF